MELNEKKSFLVNYAKGTANHYLRMVKKGIDGKETIIEETQIIGDEDMTIILLEKEGQHIEFARNERDIDMRKWKYHEDGSVTIGEIPDFIKEDKVGVL